MKALIFEYKIPRMAYAVVGGKISQRAYLSRLGPFHRTELPMPSLLGEDWAVLKTQLTGICGSDTKQIFLDADWDNPLSSMVSFPMVLGHEVIGAIEQVGTGVLKRKVGERVALNPWLSCAPRGITPPCPACQKGHYFHCENFTSGKLPRGMHIGNNSGVTGGFAEWMPAHESQLFPVPDEIDSETAVLADPFSVSLHSVLKAPPPADGLAIVYGCGTLGMLTIAILNALYPTCKIIAIARHDRQEKLALEMGADLVIRTRQPIEIIEAIGKRTGKPLQRPIAGMPWIMGGVDVIYDTVGSAETIEVGLRITKPRGSIVITGVSRPRRFDWTPHYFKEINLLGSNAFGVEDFEGERLHGFEIFFHLLSQKRLQLPQMVTHRYRLEQYQDAMLVAQHKDKHQAIKVVFEFI